MKEEFEITVVDTKTGEPETIKINEKNCWVTLMKMFVYGTDLTPKKPDKPVKIQKKPVKMQLKLISAKNK